MVMVMQRYGSYGTDLNNGYRYFLEFSLGSGFLSQFC
jgi:hypothetical protein